MVPVRTFFFLLAVAGLLESCGGSSRTGSSDGRGGTTETEGGSKGDSGGNSGSNSGGEQETASGGRSIGNQTTSSENSGGTATETSGSDGNTAVGGSTNEGTSTTTDNESPSIIVLPTTGLETSEAGAKATFGMVLGTAPTSPVAVSFTSTDTTEGTVLPATVIFTTDNWSVAQTITVTGVNDSADDENVDYTIVSSAAVSADLAYNGLVVADVSITNIDDDEPCSTPSLIDDMEDGNNVICNNEGRSGLWYSYNDSTTGTTSTLPYLATRGDSLFCIETVGSQIGNWGMTFGAALLGNSWATRLPYNASKYNGIAFWARRGLGASYPTAVNVQLPQSATTRADVGGTCVGTDCSDHYFRTINLTASWTYYELPFGTFSQNGWYTTPVARDLTTLLGVEFYVKYPESYSYFEVDIDDLKFY